MCWQHMGGRREVRTFQANLCGKKIKPWLKKGEERRKRREEEKKCLYSNLEKAFSWSFFIEYIGLLVSTSSVMSHGHTKKTT